MSQYLKIETIGSTGSIILAIFEVQVERYFEARLFVSLGTWIALKSGPSLSSPDGHVESTAPRTR